MNDGKSHPPLHGQPLHRDGRRATDEPARVRPKAEGRDAFTWLNRGQGQGGGGRHGAITRTLYSWSSYKSWADKVRNTWDREK